jgi:periplasmic divalent cation tolerance protein
MSDFVELVLTCGSWQEAQRIVDVLLEKRLIACAEFLEVKSDYLWRHERESAKEIKLIMQSIPTNFAKVEAEVAKLHSYETFVLQALPVQNISNQARKWLESEMK